MLFYKREVQNLFSFGNMSHLVVKIVIDVHEYEQLKLKGMLDPIITSCKLTTCQLLILYNTYKYPENTTYNIWKIDVQSGLLDFLRAFFVIL